jgi:NADPH-dependent 2,4-dienoyl-CoA reductase/sulfur reductase-like enzyme
MPDAGDPNRRVVAAPVVIVGASLGGLRTAESLRRHRYAGPIVVIGDELHLPYNRPPLSKEGLSNGVTHDDIAFAQRESLADVQWRLGRTVTSADLQSQTVTTDDGSVVGYSALVIATGLRPRRLQIAGAQKLVGRHTLRTLDDATALRRDLVPGARVVVIGSGFVGCEVAATATALGCAVTVVSTSVLPLIRPLGEVLAGEIRRVHEAHGVEFRLGRSVVEFSGDPRDPRVAGVVLDDGSVLDADVVIEAVGSSCNVEWLAGEDLQLDDGVLVDGAMRAVRADGTPHSSVWAVGDIARFANPVFDDVARRVEHWNIPTDTAKRAGAVLATWLAGDAEADSIAAQPFTLMPSFWSDQFELRLQASGLPHLADVDGIRLIEGEIGSACIMGYFRADRLIGVVGVGAGITSALVRWRQRIAEGTAD